MAGITGRAPGYGMPYGYYPPAYAPSMNGYQMPMQQAQQPVMQQPGQLQAGPQMTLPTVHADILQVADEEAMEKQPVDAGTSQMMISRDETVIGVKSVLANGESTLDLYRKQPRTPKAAEPEYITREEFENRLAEMIRAEAERPALRVVRTETAEDDGAEDDEPPRTGRTRSTGGARRR